MFLSKLLKHNLKDSLKLFPCLHKVYIYYYFICIKMNNSTSTSILYVYVYCSKSSLHYFWPKADFYWTISIDSRISGRRFIYVKNKNKKKRHKMTLSLINASDKLYKRKETCAVELYQCIHVYHYVFIQYKYYMYISIWLHPKLITHIW